MPTMPAVNLPLDDAAELADLLHFLKDWIDADEAHLDPLLTRFVGNGYTLIDLRVDLIRLAGLITSESHDEHEEMPY